MALTDKLTAIANAIRAKTGKSDSLTLDQMPTEIASIQTGGGGGSAEGCVTVTFMNGDVELFSRPVYIGDDCPDPITQGRFDTPTKESTAQYNYTFYGWGASDGGAANANILKNITSDKTVYAIFTATARLYTITFYDEDGTTVLATKQVPYGTVPSYTPAKDGYMFDGWTPEPVAVTGDASYVVTWGTELDSGTWSDESGSGGWSLTTGYTLRIYGTGAALGNVLITNNSTGIPWSSHRANIKKVVIEEGITGTNQYLCYYCKALTSVELPSTLTAIHPSAFQSCSSLTSIVLPNSVTAISTNAFNYCTSLESINIPAKVTTIDPTGFYNCSSLLAINVDADNPTYCSVDGVVFTKDMSTVHKCPTGLTSYVIPTGTTKVSVNAFRGCSVLASITIPSSVTYIGQFAFFDDYKLASAVFEDTDGWWYASSASATSGDAVDVSDPATAAKYLRDTSYYCARHWFNS